MESWRLTWRNGFAPVLPTKGLSALLLALEKDDVRVTQGSTTTPPPLMCVQDWPVEAADAIGFVGWMDQDGKATVGEVEKFFARACFDADQIMGEPAACHWFLNWFDDTPRGEMRRELADEVRRTLAERCQQAIPEDFARSMADNPTDPLVFGAFADWCDDHDMPDMAFVYRSHAEGLNLGRKL